MQTYLVDVVHFKGCSDSTTVWNTVNAHSRPKYFLGFLALEKWDNIVSCYCQTSETSVSNIIGSDALYVPQNTLKSSQSLWIATYTQEVLFESQLFYTASGDYWFLIRTLQGFFACT